MGAPTSLNLRIYSGTLLLDNNAHQAWLSYYLPNGNTNKALLMLDPSPTGGYDPAEITAAWQYFSNKYGGQTNPPITVYGFWGYVPGGNIPVIHVVRG